MAQNSWKIQTVTLMFGKKLVIISHTAHQISPNGKVVGWGPTVNEINHLSEHWDEIVHVACIERFSDNKSFNPYLAQNIHFKSIPSFGGKTTMSKLGILIKAPIIINTILKNIQNASHIQIRVPMGIGLYVLPLFLFIPRKFILWVKYANNWGIVSSSLGYRFQRWFLIKNFLNCKVTINGFWPNQPKHCLSFENPCLNSSFMELGKNRIIDFNKKWQVVFIGRLEVSKGLDILLDAWSRLNISKIKKWVFIGDGPLKVTLEEMAIKLNLNAEFTGFLSQEKTQLLLSNSHLLILPSKSEGFPKVVSEAWNYGVIPIVSPVGSIPHYVRHNENGFLMQEVDAQSLILTFEKIHQLNIEELMKISNTGKKLSSMFTYNYYLNHLKKEILG